MQEADGALAPAPRLELQLEASAAGLVRALVPVEAFLVAHGLGAKACGRVLLLLEEAVMNVAMHGHDDAASHEVAVRLALRPDTVELRLVDDGRAFDLREAPAPSRPATLEQATPGGLGVHLMRSFARAVDYRREDERNVLTLWLDR